jgi:hypothetical protein
MSPPTIFEYLPKYAHVLLKSAMPLEVQGERDNQITGAQVERPAWHAAKTIGTGLLGFGVGSLAGAGTGMLLGDRAPYLESALGGTLLGVGSGLAYHRWKTKELQELQRALEAHRNKSERSISK